MSLRLHGLQSLNSDTAKHLLTVGNSKCFNVASHATRIRSAVSQEMPSSNPFKLDHTGPGMSSLKVLPVWRSMTSKPLSIAQLPTPKHYFRWDQKLCTIQPAAANVLVPKKYWWHNTSKSKTVRVYFSAKVYANVLTVGIMPVKHLKSLTVEYHRNMLFQKIKIVREASHAC